MRLFKSRSLPIIIENNRYGKDNSKDIPRQFVKDFFNVCCPKIQALDIIYSSKNFVAVLYRKPWAGAHFTIATFTPDGVLIARKEIARYTGDASEYVTTNVRIDESLNINIEKKIFIFAFDEKSQKEKEMLDSTIKEKFYIDEKGQIKERVDY